MLQQEGRERLGGVKKNKPQRNTTHTHTHTLSVSNSGTEAPGGAESSFLTLILKIRIALRSPHTFPCRKKSQGSKTFQYCAKDQSQKISILNYLSYFFPIPLGRKEGGREERKREGERGGEGRQAMKTATDGLIHNEFRWLGLLRDRRTGSSRGEGRPPPPSSGEARRTTRTQS